MSDQSQDYLSGLAPDIAQGAQATGMFGTSERPDYAGPGVVPQAGPVTTPGQQEGEPVSLPSNLSVKEGYGYKGTNIDKLTELQAKKPGLQGDFARAKLESAQMAADNQRYIQQAGDEAKKAQGAVNVATAQADLEEGRNAAKFADFLKAQGADEAKINAHYDAMGNQAKADYMAALADFRASGVDPAQLWKNMGPGNQFGMLVSAFAQDFLGVRGIHIGAMDTLNKAIDRNIDAQVQGIKVKSEVAEGFKHIWNMQRLQANSDAEARSRVRGFMLDGFKQGLIANMSKYKSALSEAQGQAAIAKIDEEIAKNIVAVHEHADTHNMQMRQQAIETYGINSRAAQEELNRQLQRELHAPPPPNPNQGVIYDPQALKAFGVGKMTYDELRNHIIGYVRADMMDKEGKTIKEHNMDLAKAEEVNELLEKLKSYSRKYKDSGLGGWAGDVVGKTRMAGTDQQDWENTVNLIAQRVARVTDGRVNLAEIDMNKLKAPTKLNMADTEKVISQFQNNVLGDVQAKHRQLADPSLGIKNPWEAQMADNEAIINPTPPTPEQQDTRDTIQHREYGGVGLGGPRTQEASAIEAEIGAKDPLSKARIDTANSRDIYGPKNQSKWEDDTIKLGQKALAGDKEAMKQLQKDAKEYGQKGDNANPKAVFGAFVLLHVEHALGQVKGTGGTQ